MVKRIYREPFLSPSIFTYFKEGEISYPFDQKSVRFYGYGRVALLDGLRLMDIKEGENVLLPEYVCNTVIAPMHLLKLKVNFYEVDENLTPRWETLKPDAKTRALLVINYFGFPSELETAKKFCLKNDLYLIEDNAHGFLSRSSRASLGSDGDISIFSFRKTVGLPNGAALLINNALLQKRSISPSLTKKRKILWFFAKTILHNLESLSGFSSGRPEDETKCGLEKEEEFNIEKMLEHPCGASLWMVRHLNFKKIADIRRKMYQQWLIFFKNNQGKARPIFPVLPEGAVPYIFPVLTEDRKGLISKMRESKIGVFPWPCLPEDSQESYFSKRMVCLPVSVKFEIKNFLKHGI